MNYTKLFYWLTVADNAKTFFIVFTIIFTGVAVIATIAYFGSSAESDEDSARMSRRWLWWSLPFSVLFWALFIFTPSKRDALLIVGGGQALNFLTNDSTAKQIPHELSNYIVSELKNMAKEAKVELNLQSQKEKILEEAKKMTGEQVMQRMVADSTFARIILGR